MEIHMLTMQMLHSPLSNYILDYSKYCCMIAFLRYAQQQHKTHLDALLLNAGTVNKLSQLPSTLFIAKVVFPWNLKLLNKVDHCPMQLQDLKAGKLVQSSLSRQPQICHMEAKAGLWPTLRLCHQALTLQQSSHDSQVLLCLLHPLPEQQHRISPQADAQSPKGSHSRLQQQNLDTAALLLGVLHCQSPARWCPSTGLP